MSIKRKIGLPPGSVIFIGDQRVEKVQLHHLQYNTVEFQEQLLDNQSKIIFQKSEETIDWYDVRGIHDTTLIEQIGAAFGLHSLIVEDIVDTHQRPKFEEYEKGVILILKALNFDTVTKKIAIEQIGIYFRKGLLLTFQEDHSDIFLAVRQRIHVGKGKIRQREADYLAYALLDVLVDNYFYVLEQVEQEIETLEDNLLITPDASSKESIHYLKKEIIKIRKSVAPLREAISRFSKSESEFIEESTGVFIRDLHDHTIQVMDRIDTYRDILNGLQDLYLSEISFKMNQVMQVLTIITTIFVPLSFLTGLYGMNFDNIPELHHPNGYPLLLGFMFLVAAVLIFYFKKKNWF